MNGGNQNNGGWTAPSVILTIISLIGMVVVSYNTFRDDVRGRVAKLEWQVEQLREDNREMKALLDNIWGKQDMLRAEVREKMDDKRP